MYPTSGNFVAWMVRFEKWFSQMARGWSARRSAAMTPRKLRAGHVARRGLLKARPQSTVFYFLYLLTSIDVGRASQLNPRNFLVKPEHLPG